MSRSTLAALVACLLVMMVVAIASNADPVEFDSLGDPDPAELEAITGIRAASSTSAEDGDSSEPNTGPRAEVPDWLVGALGATAALAALWLLSKQRFSVALRRRRGRASSTNASMSERDRDAAIAELADDLVAELEIGSDPRLAIQRVYASVETGFGVRDLRRKPAETPLRYLDRMFGRRADAADALTRLTEHFQRARFSDEPISEAMRADAIDALQTIRDSYGRAGRVRARTQ